MTKLLSSKRMAVAGAALCLATVAYGSSALPAVSATVSRVAAITTARSVLTATAVGSPGPTATKAAGRAAKTVTSARSKPSTTAPRTTSTTIMGGGSPATWPAARAVAPSLAGAYSPHLKTAFISLVKYSDWLGSHPNPSLVKNYVQPSSDIYKAQLYLMRDLESRGWHEAPNPTEVDFVKVVKVPLPKTTATGRRVWFGGHPTYRAGVIDVVINQKIEPYLNKAGGVVGHSAGGGPTAWTVSLTQNVKTGEFLIDEYQRAKANGGIALWERQVKRKS
jgi:hypothetical protein